jgi:pyridoxamine 5'-phosphate oxidase-like protein
VRWSEIERAQPRLAGLARQRLIGPGVVLVATIRRDGTPRISPVEPFLLDGELWLSMMWQSAKARDLVRDPRILVHSVIASRDGAEGEVKVRGIARTEHQLAVQRRYAKAVAASLGWDPQPGRFHLFAVDISHIAVISYDTDSGNQRVAMWPPGREFVRRATTATSVGDPEPTSGLIDAADRRSAPSEY